MNLPVYVINAFASQPFQGNPAAICPLPEWLPDSTLQAIAAQNNLSETAYFVPGEKEARLRWFTPTCEVDLCGHATLASAYAAFELLGYTGDDVAFNTRSGAVSVRRHDDRLALNFPAQPGTPATPAPQLVAAVGVTPVETVEGMCPYFILENETQVRDVRPDQAALGLVGIFAVCVTAPGDTVDFVSRFFAPGAGIPEDPVTGAAHCTLTPYWAAKLGKNRLQAQQLSARGGELEVELQGDRVEISGQCNLYLEGQIRI